VGKVELFRVRRSPFLSALTVAESISLSEVSCHYRPCCGVQLELVYVELVGDCEPLFII